MKSLERFRAWRSYDWESFPKDTRGHAALVRQLRKAVRSKYHLKLVKIDRKEARIAERHGRRPHYYVAHNPDLIITDGEKPDDRVFIEYVNTLGGNLQNFLRDLRGMLALSTVVQRGRGFVLAIRHSIYRQCWPTALPKNSPVEIMSLKSMLDLLNHGNLDDLFT